MSAEILGDAYFVGSITYRCPWQGIETISFCYRADNEGGFELYRDYAPYNERKNHPKTA